MVYVDIVAIVTGKKTIGLYIATKTDHKSSCKPYQSLAGLAHQLNVCWSLVLWAFKHDLILKCNLQKKTFEI